MLRILSLSSGLVINRVTGFPLVHVGNRLGGSIGELSFLHVMLMGVLSLSPSPSFCFAHLVFENQFPGYCLSFEFAGNHKLL